ncbi:LysR family transcriptional regulator [Permianibacter sp. IMCC34836]|uniref:LysR family transcriptional regulator n=1 Tax=Permianibacter fluminis TaxID=2738515 RepID=UPI001553AB74|nr:LysR family transcriptional regulator [Permianibacter fluminis]NQD37240.1 LysR family transcriptional regulator [Permianibacter fluminis]
MSLHVTLRQLELFKAVAEYGGISEAARRLHVTQPTVSMQLKALADSIGEPLFDNRGRKLVLTPAGNVLQRAAVDMFQRWEAVQAELADLRGLRQGRLRVAIVSTAKYFLPRWLGSFCQAYPGVEIALEVANRDRILQRLGEQLDDVYIMSAPPQNMPIEQTPILDNPLDLIAPTGHALAGRQLLLGALQDEPFILREPGSGTRIACDQFFAGHDFAPRIRMELGSNEAIKQAVAGGLGLGIVSRHALAAADADGLVRLPVIGFPLQTRWHLVRHRKAYRSVLVDAFMRHLQTVVADRAEGHGGSE